MPNWFVGLALLVATGSAGCTLPAGAGRSRLLAVPLDPPALPSEAEPGFPASRVALSGAGGEWLDFTAEHEGESVGLRVGPLRGVVMGDAVTAPANARIYRVADVPVDTNSAGYLRLYGGAGNRTQLPRALMALEEVEGSFRLPPGQSAPTRLWIDLELPRGLPRGKWRATLEAIAENGRVLATLPVEIASHGFDLPRERTLVVSAPLEWDALVALWPETFAAVSPTLLSRRENSSTQAVAVLEQMVRAAQADRVQVTVPALGGVMKWPAGRPPEAWWQDFDELVVPWLTGEAFKDGVGLRDWPVPRLADMERFAQQARSEYWSEALGHLDAIGLLDRTVVLVDESHVGADPAALRRGTALSPAERLRLSQEAGRLALAYPHGAIAVPLESDQVRFTGPQDPSLYPPEHADRLVIRGDGLVTDHATRPWPAGLPQPRRFLELEGSSSAPMPGPGASEADVRLWGWLAFLRGATHLQPGAALPPPSDGEAGDPTRMVLFYPGEAFGVSGPVPSVQLKWLRRAQQDYEYLHAAAARQEETYARVIARGLVRPVRVEAGGQVDPLLPLIAGTPAPELWREGVELVAGKIAIAEARGGLALPPRFETDHTNQTTAWLAPRERPLPIVLGTRWDLTENQGRRRIVLQLETGIYNPTDASPEGMTLSFLEMPGGEPPAESSWETPGTIAVDPIATYETAQVRVATSTPVDALGYVFPTYQQGPLRLQARNEYTGAAGTTSVVTPAVIVDERGEPPVVDGLLGEWLGNEAIIDGRMVLMHDRPALQSGQVQRTVAESQAFVAWTGEGLHIAFRLEGVDRSEETMRTTRNFVETEYRRIWDEDVCELLIQPVWTVNGDPTDGPLLHVVCKPDGAFARRRVDRRTAAEPWQNFESGMRFAATVDEEGVWRAEVTLPWSALRGAFTEEQLGELGREARPELVRFNLSHHDGETGRSASWAGPVDFGADDKFTGALVLRSAAAGGPGGG